MKTTDIKYEKIVQEIYFAIEGDIGCLKDNLGAETVEQADINWHNNEWSCDRYSQFGQSAACIQSLLDLLKALKIPKRYRDAKFEGVARLWANLL